MLSCRELVQETTANPDLLDDGQSLRLSVRLHLIMCRHCRRYIRQLRTLLGLLRRRPTVTPPCPPETVDRIWTAIQKAKSD